MNNDDRLVNMANHISLFFEVQPSRDEAIEGIRNHLRKFWDPRMRGAIIRYQEEGGTELRELAAAAVSLLAAQQRTAA